VESTVSPRRAELLSATLRRFVRRGARGHISKLLGKTRPEDVALQFGGLTPSDQLAVFRILLADYREAAGHVLTELEPPTRLAILEQLEPSEIAGLLEEMPVDDAVGLVTALPAELHEQVLELVDRGDLTGVQAQLVFEDDSAGRIMNPDYLALADDTSVGEAIRAVQGTHSLENVFYLYVVDAGNHLVGVTSLRQLLLAPPEQQLREVMTRSIIKAHTDTDQEEVARLAARYDLLAIPVTDGSNRLMGIITVDDIIDVFKEEATEDFLKMVGTSDSELVYQMKSIKVAGIRLPWLLINLAGLLTVGGLIKHFQVSFSEALFLLTFVPVIMGMGGNVGSQTSTLAVRGLATGHVALGEGRARRFVFQQLRIGAVLGVICAGLAAVGAYVLEGVLHFSDSSTFSAPMYAAIVGAALFLAILVASCNGAVIPLLFKRLGVDPAVAAGPLVSTMNDLTGIVIYFGIAAALFDLLMH